MADSSVEKFKRSVDDRYRAFRSDFDKLLTQFAVSNTEGRVAAGRELLKRCYELDGLLVEGDRPKWLAPVKVALERYVQNIPDTQFADKLVKVLATQFNNIEPVELDVDQSPYNFDEAYQRFRTEHGIGELFDTLIGYLTEIIESGEVDSIALLEGLQRIVAILRANRDGSHVATKCAVETGQFFDHLVGEALKAVPGVKQIVCAYEQTLKETADALKQVENDIRNEMAERAFLGIPRLEAMVADLVKRLPPPNDGEQRKTLIEVLAITTNDGDSSPA